MSRTAGLVTLLALVGCAPAERPKPLELPAPIPVEGTYYHTVTQLEFPESLAGFSRTGVTQYDPDAVNVSGHYALSGSHPATATVYHYPATSDGSLPTEEMVMEHFRAVKRDIEITTPGASLITESIYEARINGFDLRGLHAVYQFPRFGGFDEPVDSTVYLFVIGNWYLKFRFTFPRESARGMDLAESQFISGIRWYVPGDHPDA